MLAPFLAASSFFGFGAHGLSDGRAALNAEARVDNKWHLGAFDWRGPDFSFRDWNFEDRDRGDKDDDDRGRGPMIAEVSPRAGEVGTRVRLTGQRFGDDSIIRFGDGAIHDVSVAADGRSLTFAIPEYMGQYCPPDKFCTMIAHEVTPGDYKLRVVSGDETSNAVAFTVTAEDDEANGRLSITGVDAPAELEVGEEGDWTVHAASSGAGNLRYSVDWDEQGFAIFGLRARVDVQSSASFTHRYDRPGTYHPRFTVTDEQGRSASVSASVVVR